MYCRRGVYRGGCSVKIRMEVGEADLDIGRRVGGIYYCWCRKVGGCGV
jgi:hypothetical protein